MQYIGLLDCNNFFVSCERLFRPDLWGRPVVVLSSNDGCIVARSQEVKDKGIPMGVPYFQVKDTLAEQGTTIFSAHFALYRDISRRVFAALAPQVATLEQYSIDEAFFRYTGDDPQATAADIKRQIEQAVGIPVSVALAPTKTQVKWANQRAKRTCGAYSVNQDTFRQEAADTLLSTIWGVGRQRSRQFADHTLHTVADLVAADPARVGRLFGIAGTRLQQELSGQSVLPVTPVRPAQQSVMSSRSFASASTAYAVAADAVAYHLRQVAADVRAQGQVATTLTVSLLTSRHGTFFLHGGSATATFPVPTADTFALGAVAEGLLGTIWRPNIPYTKAGVTLSGLTSGTATTTSLFASERDTAPLLRAIDRLNQRYGTEQVQIGSRTRARNWQSKCAQLSPAYTTHWSALPVVSATMPASG